MHKHIPVDVLDVNISGQDVHVSQISSSKFRYCSVFGVSIDDASDEVMI